MPTTRRVLFAFVTLLTLAGHAVAGPPLICHPFDVGTSAVLPWSPGSGWNTPDLRYDVRQLTADTLRLLSADAPVLARMENLRRATIYAAADPQVADELLAAVVGRASSAEAAGHAAALAWFDAGYLIESYRQASLVFRWDMLPARERSRWTLRDEPAIDGYGMIRKALALSNGNADIEFAASLISKGDVSAAHRRRALDRAAAGSLLARNLGR